MQDRGAWQATAHGVAKTRLSDYKEQVNALWCFSENPLVSGLEGGRLDRKLTQIKDDLDCENAGSPDCLEILIP